MAVQLENATRAHLDGPARDPLSLQQFRCPWNWFGHFARRRINTGAPATGHFKYHGITSADAQKIKRGCPLKIFPHGHDQHLLGLIVYLSRCTWADALYDFTHADDVLTDWSGHRGVLSNCD